MKVLTIELTEKTNLSLDGVNAKEYTKGTKFTASSTLQEAIFTHLIESGKAKRVGGQPEKQAKGKKKSTPKENKGKSKGDK